MLKIFVCEDNEKQRAVISQTVKDIIMIENLDMMFELDTADPYEIIEIIKNDSSSGLYFLDVDLQCDINGIKLGEDIRKYDPRGFIIYVTTHAEMSYLTFKYKVEALDYIIKDDFEEMRNRIHKCILNVNEKYCSKVTDIQRYFSIKTNDKIINVLYRDILFFETSPNVHKIVLHANNRQIEFYGKLNDIKSELDDRFARCHRSYIVNKERIRIVNKKERNIEMDNGQECLVSVRGLKNLK